MVYIFTDASVNSKNGVGVSGILIVKCLSMDDIEDSIEFLQFSSTKCTEVEIKGAIFAIKKVVKECEDIKEITLFTDCKTLVDLIEKRLEKLSLQNFKKRDGTLLEHANIYKELYNISKLVKIDVKKIKGHSKERITLEEKIFTKVDQAVRKQLRKIL